MAFTGFQKLPHSTYLYDPPSPDKKSSNPDAILLFTWLGAEPRNISKYLEHYKRLYPSSRIVLCRCDFSDLLISPATAVNRAQTAINLIPSTGTDKPPRLLVHAWSNGGAYYLQAACRAYRRSHGAAFPPALVILDSTPGSDKLRGSFTKSLDLARTVLPKSWYMRLFAWIYASVFVFALFFLPRLRGYPGLPVILRKALNDPKLLSTAGGRCYFYSDGDSLIDAEEVEEHGDQARAKGYAVDLVSFKGTQHVAHMKADPDRYWNTVTLLWQRAMSQ